jgi:hypothetical protein
LAPELVGAAVTRSIRYYRAMVTARPPVAATDASPTPKAARRRFAPGLLAGLLTLAHFALAVYYGLVIPVGEAPDEVPHYDYVRFLARERRLPVGSESGSEGIQPPLYYAVAALLTATVPEGDFRVHNNPDFSLARPETQRNALLHPATEDWPYRDGALAWHLIRLLSAVLGAVTVLGVYGIGRQVFPQTPGIALTASGFVSLLPGFIAGSAVINNDNAVILLTTWSLLLMIRIWGSAGRSPAFVALGLLLGLAVLAKASGLVLLALLPVLALRPRSRQLDQRLATWRGRLEAPAGPLLAGGICFLVAGWWFLRNQALYGDPLAWQFKVSTSDAAAGVPLLEHLAATLRGLYVSFWGKFGGVIHLPLPEWLYALLGAAVAISLIGYLRRARRSPNVRPAIAWGAAGLLALHGVILLAAFVRWTLALLGTGQARLIFPGIAAIALLIGAGAWQLAGPARRRFLLGGAAVALGALAVAVPPAFIAPAYAGSPVLLALPPGLPAGPVTVFGPALELAAVVIPAPAFAPGSAAPIDLAWRARETPGIDLRLRLSLRAPDGRLLAAKDGSPSAGLDTTDRWRAGELRVARHYLDLPDATPAGRHTLSATLYPAGAPEDPIASAPIGTLAIGRNRPLPGPYLPAAVDFGPFRLTGYRLGEARPGETLQVALRWQARESRPEPAYTVFVHLTDDQGRLVAQHDGPPQDGAYPTSIWSAGDEIGDVHAIPLPASLPAATYQVRVGLYEPATGRRLPASGTDHALLGAVRLR